VTIDWTLDLFFPRDITQIQGLRANRLRVDHYEPGELIIAKHEIGREVFIMKAGEVEVFDPGEHGNPEKILAHFKKGEVFGERALLEDIPRAASVRAVTPVDVVVMSRDDFTTMVDQFPVLDDYFDKLMKERYPDALPHAVPLVQQMAAPVAMPGARKAS
jgi:CRP-like cAMP-binding protein